MARPIDRRTAALTAADLKPGMFVVYDPRQGGLGRVLAEVTHARRSRRLEGHCTVQLRVPGFDRVLACELRSHEIVELAAPMGEGAVIRACEAIRVGDFDRARAELDFGRVMSSDQVERVRTALADAAEQFGRPELALRDPYAI